MSGPLDTIDPVDRESSDVQAAVAYYAGVDNLKFGSDGITILDHFRRQGEASSGAAFDSHRWDAKANRFERISDPDAIRNRLRATSPIHHVKPTSAPVLLLHGEDDKLVPIQQSELLYSRLSEVGVPCKLVKILDAGHGFSNGWKTPMPGEIPAIMDWFNEHLLTK